MALTTVFTRLKSSRYDCLPDVSTSHAGKKNASNPKKNRQHVHHLKYVKRLLIKAALRNADVSG